MWAFLVISHGQTKQGENAQLTNVPCRYWSSMGSGQPWALANWCPFLRSSQSVSIRFKSSSCLVVISPRRGQFLSFHTQSLMTACWNLRRGPAGMRRAPYAAATRWSAFSSTVRSSGNPLKSEARTASRGFCGKSAHTLTVRSYQRDLPTGHLALAGSAAALISFTRRCCWVF